MTVRPARLLQVILACGVIVFSWFSPRPLAAAGTTPLLLLGSDPAGGVLAGHMPIVLHFNRPLLPGAVQSAWQLQPAAPGRLTVAAARVTFEPTAPWQPGRTYRLLLASTVLSAAASLPAPVRLTFQGGDGLRVRSVSPVNGSTGVPPNGRISISFNHPMVPLVGAGMAPPNPPGWHVSITPHLPGHGSWLGTSTWVYQPAAALQPSTHYTVILAAGAQDSSGLHLGLALRWQFSTIKPEVFSRRPRSGASYANPHITVRVTFNQAMQHASAARHFTLRTGGTSVPGVTRWQGPALLFTPAAPLSSRSPYTVRVAAGARSAIGRGTLSRTVRWQFSVAPPPRLDWTDPAEGKMAYAGQYPYEQPGAQSEYHVTLNFNTPMDKASLDRRLTLTPTIDHLQTFLSQTSNGWRYDILGDFAPSTPYVVAIAPGATDAFGRPLPTRITLHFRTGPLAPGIALYGSPGAPAAISFTAGRVVPVPIQIINIPRVHYILRRTTVQYLDAVNGNDSEPLGTTIRTWTDDVPHPLDHIEDIKVPLAGTLGEPLPPGVYWLDASTTGNVPGLAPGASPPESAEVVYVTSLGITMKSGNSSTLVWVTSAKTGRPAAGKTVQLINYQGSLVATGKTNDEGLHLFPRQSQATAVVVAPGAFGVAAPYWSPQLPPNSPFTSYGYGGNGGSYVYTDRPVYRPGQTVHFRAVLWHDVDEVYSSLGPTQVQIRAWDGRGKRLLWTHATLDRYGTVRGSFQLPSTAATGYGSISVNIPHGPGGGIQFLVAEYRTPEFLAKVTTSAPAYVQGRPFTATAKVRYVFGAPVIRQHVSWTVYAQPRIPFLPGWDQYTFFDWSAFQWQPPPPNSSQFGRVLARGSGTTNAHGNLSIPVRLNLGDDRFDQSLTLEVTATDVNHQSISARVQLPGYRSNLAIGLQAADQIVPAAQPASVKIVTVQQDGTVLPQTRVTAEVDRRTYTNKLVQNNGTSSWQSVPHDSPILTRSLTTNAHGEATLTFTPPEAGEYVVVVQGKDAVGNPAATSLTIDATAAGQVNWGLTTDTSLNLRPDRPQYSVGETAHLLIAAPYAGSALITEERGTIRRYRVVHIAAGAPTIAVPITLDDVPDIFVTVSLYHGTEGNDPPEWRYGQIEVHVDAAPRHVVVTLRQNGYRHHPRGVVRYAVTTTDGNGHPVSAAISLALVDSAVLALADDPSGDIMQSFYPEAGDSVQTGSDGVLSIDHLTATPASPLQGPTVIHGGLPAPTAAPSTGGGGPGVPPKVTVRSHFAATAYWRATVVTSASGHATVTVHLPDNATTWDLLARAITTQQQVGQATMSTLATQDLVLRPVLPRFLVEGISLRLGTALNNTTGRPAITRVSITSARLGLHTGRVITVPAHGERLLLWPVTVTQAGSTDVLLRADSLTAGIRGDAVFTHLPSHVPLTDETVATAAEVYGKSVQPVILPRDAVAHPGDLTVQVSASLTAGLGRALAALRPRASESNEDVADRLRMVNALRSLPASITGLTARQQRSLPLLAASAVQKLLDKQFPDGGWPWFDDGVEWSDPLVSSDAIEALARSGHHGRPVRMAIQRGRMYLRGELTQVTNEEQPALLLALADSGGAPGRAARTLYDNTVTRSHLPTMALADLGLTLLAAHDRPLAEQVLAVLQSRVVVSATGANWEDGDGDPWGGPPVATTVEALRFLLALTPHDPSVPAAVRWLMFARQGDGWDDSHDSAVAVETLAGYARARQEGEAAYQYRVSFAGRTRLAGAYGARQAGSSRTAIPVAQLRTGRPAVTVTRSLPDGSAGRGPLYVLTRLRYYLPANGIAPLNEGISVARRYTTLQDKPVHTITAGKPLKVVLSIRTTRTLLYLNIRDPLPAGCEPIDGSLNTSQQGLIRPPPWWFWQPTSGPTDLTPYLSHVDLRDDRADMYAYFVPPGTYRYTYLVRATVPGRYGVAPTHAEETFFPEVFGRSAGQTFTVRG